MSHVHSNKARFRAAQDTRKNLERAVKMEEYQERRSWHNENTHEQYPKHIGNLLDIGNYATQLYIMIRTFKKEPGTPINQQV